jgi:DedD protein
MSLAFWRRKNAAVGATPRSSRSADDDSGRADPTAALRARARRRLIGAAALLLLAVVVVPMLLDPEPRPVADNIPIDIPSEKSKFSPRLSLPPVPAPENVPVAPPPDASPAATTSAAPSSSTNDKSEKAARADVTKPEASRNEAAKADEQRALAALEGKAPPEKLPAPVKGGKFAVQAAATATESAARDLAERLKKGGLAPYTERIDTAEGTRFRVRLGPYASREEADRVRARLKGLGINGNVVTV